MKIILAGLALVATTLGAQAGETYDSSGSVAGQSSARLFQLAENHLVMLLPSAHTGFEMEAEGHPFTGLNGSCDGALEALNGTVLGQGICVYESAAGETLAVRWSGKNMTADGALHGRWLVIGGTGGMAGMSGGGNFISITDRATGASELTLTGAVSTQ